jgi:hypothetical protein
MSGQVWNVGTSVDGETTNTIKVDGNYCTFLPIVKFVTFKRAGGSRTVLLEKKENAGEPAFLHLLRTVLLILLLCRGDDRDVADLSERTTEERRESGAASCDRVVPIRRSPDRDVRDAVLVIITGHRLVARLPEDRDERSGSTAVDPP